MSTSLELLGSVFGIIIAFDGPWCGQTLESESYDSQLDKRINNPTLMDLPVSTSPSIPDLNDGEKAGLI